MKVDECAAQCWNTLPIPCKHDRAAYQGRLVFFCVAVLVGAFVALLVFGVYMTHVFGGVTPREKINFFCSMLLRCDLLAKKVRAERPTVIFFEQCCARHYNSGSHEAALK